MINFSCPGCQATFKLPDEMAGKTARCSKCNQRFSVPGGKPKPAAGPAAPAGAVAAGAAPAAAPLAAPKAPAMPEVLEAEVVDEPAPAPRRPQRAAAVDEVDVVDEVQVVDEAAIQETPRRGRRPMPAADEDDDDDRRRPSRRDRDRDRDDDWDEDADADRPRRKRRRERSGNPKMGIIMASVGGGAFVMMIICFVGMTLTAGPAVVVRNAPINFNPQPMPFNPAPIPNQGQPNQGQPNQPNPMQPNQPNPMQPNQGQPNQPNPMQPKIGGNPNVGAGGGGRQIQLVNGLFQTQDRIALNDPMDPRRAGYHMKRYTVQLEAGKSYAIEMDAVGPIFDPFLRVENQAANFFHEDDDSGVGDLDAKVVFLAPQTGTYTITATTFHPRMQGNYRLTVRTPP